MIERIQMSSPEIDDSDIAAVVEVLRSGRLSLGARTKEFEQAISKYVGVRHTVAVSSGSAALHLIVKSLGIGPGDEVLVPSFTFAASISCLLNEGATPVFCDIDEETYNIDPGDLKGRITTKTKAILAVDVFGQPADWRSITKFAANHGLRVIEDSCEALGAEYEGRKVGQFGDAAAFAFYPNKQITTGEGGVIVTDDSEIARLTRSLRNQGRSEMGSRLEHERVGFNYRMDEMSAALGLSQLKRIGSFLEKRKRVAEYYSQRLKNVPYVRTPQVARNVRMSWFVYVVTLDECVDRTGVIEDMQRRQIPVRCYFSPMHLQRYVSDRLHCRPNDLPITESVARRTLALPFHNRLTGAEINEIVDALQKAAYQNRSRNRAASA